MLCGRAKNLLVAGFNGFDQRMILGNFRAGNRNERFVLHAVFRMFFTKVKDKLLEGHARFFQRHRRRHAHIEENVRAVWRAAHAPGITAADAAYIYCTGLAVVGRLLFPNRNPVVNRRQNFFHAKHGTQFLLSAREAGMHVVALHGKTNPHRAVMAKN